MRNLKQGFIMQIVIIVIALVALGFYFDLDIIGFFKKPEVQNVLIGLKNGVLLTWMYVKSAVAYVGGLF